MGLFKKIGKFIKSTNPIGMADNLVKSVGKFAEERQDRVLDRKELKYEYKLDKQELKTTQKALAYEAGFNPTADIWSGISSSVQGLAQGATSIFGGSAGGMLGGFFGNTNPNNPSAYVETNKQMIWIVLGLVAVVLLFKGKN